MFHIISNPFLEMAQGAVSNGLGYATERSEESENFTWFWKIVVVLFIIMGVVLISNYHDKIHREKLEEEREKFEEKRVKSLKK